MIYVLIFAVVSSLEPYSFEIAKGPALEIAGGGQFLDDDPTALAGELRLSFIAPSKADTLITGEICQSLESVFVGKIHSTPFRKYLSKAGAAFYEFYNPYSFRLAFGGGAEFRSERIRGLLYYRGGLGIYLSPSWAIFADLEQDFIDRAGGRIVSPLAGFLSIHKIF